MEALYFAAIAPIIPVLFVAGAWVFSRRATPARGVGGLSCDDVR
jgi:hypothetical protein